PFVVVPQRRERARRQRKLDHDLADLIRLRLFPAFGQHMDVVSRYRQRWRTWLDREDAEAGAVGDGGPSELRLPPVTDHWYAQPLSRPGQRVWIAAFSGQKQQAEAREIVRPHEFSFRILALDSPERSGCREEDIHAMLFTHAPECAGIRRAHGFSF